MSRHSKVLLVLTATLWCSSATAQWKYSTHPDPLDDEPVAQASVKSKNQHQFSFPYRGGTRAMLVLRQKGEEEPHVMLLINRGQFMCAPEPCVVRLRFDSEDDADDYQGTLPSDHSTDALFIGSETVFFEKISDAKRLRIQTTFFREGTLVFDFDVSKLKWPPPAKPAKK